MSEEYVYRCNRREFCVFTNIKKPMITSLVISTKTCPFIFYSIQVVYLGHRMIPVFLTGAFH